MKRSFIIEKESTLDALHNNKNPRDNAYTDRSASDINFGNSYLNYLNGAVEKDGKLTARPVKSGKVTKPGKLPEIGSDSDLFQSDECDEKRSYTPQPKINSTFRQNA